ncbi:antitoxin [Spirochaetia bacterium]|nr:antitoxin [Spirochaetia bacterium]
MPNIRPVSDLRNNFAEISKSVHESSEPVFLTKNGYGDMVVMSMEAWEEKQFESEIYDKLIETEARLSDKRLSHEEVFSGLRRRIKDRIGNERRDLSQLISK